MEIRSELATASRRVVSASCFRVVSLQFEMQNEVEVLKPLLEELEVLRLSCALGALPSVNPKDFEFGFLQPKEFDDEFARFLRADVFGEGANGSKVCVFGLFGKQAQVKNQLRRLGGWDQGMETKLLPVDLGMYVVVLPRSHDDPDGAKTVAVFPWLVDEYFRPERLRDTPTYMARLLTCMTKDVTCCLSNEDKLLMEKSVSDDEAGFGTGKGQQWRSFSVAFRVEQKPDQRDEVRVAVESTVPTPDKLQACRKVAVVKGAYPALTAITEEPSAKAHRERLEKFGSVDAFCSWLSEQLEWFAVESQSSQWPDYVKEAVLARFGKWPSRELESLDANLCCSVRKVEDEVETTLMEQWSTRRSNLLLVGNNLFRVEALTGEPSMINDATEVKNFVRYLRNDRAFVIDEESMKILKLPVRLPKMMKCFSKLFFDGDTDRLDHVLTTAHQTTAKEIAKNEARSIMRYVRSWASWLSGPGGVTIPLLFREHMQAPLETMKQLWWAEVTLVLDAYEARVKETRVQERVRAVRAYWDVQRKVLVNNVFEDLSKAWLNGRSSSLKLSFLLHTGTNRLLHCRIDEEYFLPHREQLHVWKLKDATSGTDKLHCTELGKLDLDDREEILGLFTVQTRSLLIVSISGGVARVRKIEFPVADGWFERSPTVKQLREFRRLPCLCDYSVAERMLVLGDKAGLFAIYRVSESFASMEVMRHVDTAVKTSLAMPVAEVALSDGILFLIDNCGALQSLNTRNQQASRKHSLVKSSNPAWKFPLVRVCNGGALAWLELASDVLNFRFVAADDLRELPLHGALDLSLLSPQGLVYGELDDSVYAVDMASGSIHQIKVEVSLKSESFSISAAGRQGKFNPETSPTSTGDETIESDPLSDHWLWTFYHVYEKFPVRGELDRLRAVSPSLRLRPEYDIFFHLSSDSRDGFYRLLAVIKERLELLSKPLYGMDFMGGDSYTSGSRMTQDLTDPERTIYQPATTFLRELVTFVPIQICRAEANTLTLMVDGRHNSDEQQPSDSSDLHSADIARDLRFGLLSPLLVSWGRQCIVITSMGKQSTGKSYFLNHLTGSSFAISGERCTDGAWMSLQFLPSGVMLVVIDFEGLGSFERTEQEDVFLSVLNASVSMLTIFRMEMRLDKEIDEMFSKFQKGSQLIKNDPQLFRGKLYMSIKDVNPNDQRGVVGEFATKIGRLLAANKEQNFLTDMYAGQVDINCSPPLGTAGYYQSLSEAQRYVTRGLCTSGNAGFPSGKAFHDCVRLLLAKISILDWTSLDDSSTRFKVGEYLRMLPTVVRFGVSTVWSDGSTGSGSNASQGRSLLEELVSALDGSQIHVSFEEVCGSCPAVADRWREIEPVVHFDELKDEDTDLFISLNPVDADQIVAASQAIAVLFTKFHEFVLAAGVGPPIIKKSSQAEFDSFLSFVIRRRSLRIQRWCRSVFAQRTPEVWSTAEQQALGTLRTLFVRCLDSCSSCQLGCMKASAHCGWGDLSHDCGTNHRCAGVCAYCSDLQVEGKTPHCSKPGGHEGRCECESGDHTCRRSCVLDHAANCAKECTKKAGHAESESHRCAVGLHKCGQPCLALPCSRLCVQDVEMPHAAHKCEVDRCLAPCVMDGCDRTCSFLDHFHGHTEAKIAFDSDNPGLAAKNSNTFDEASVTPSVHMCDETHACHAMCEEDGICNIDVFLKQSSKTFVGARGSFQYTFQEMNGSRRKCAHTLAPGQMAHAGSHLCVVSDVASDEDAECETKHSDIGSDVRHYCDARCPCCSYFCQKEYGHSGVHKTSHGNMRNTMFFSDEHDIDFLDRKYTAGESGTAEMCNLYCSKMGREHVHFLDCEKMTPSQPCIYTGSKEDMRRHCNRILDPKPERQQDELLHERFWDTLGWEDPCSSVQEREEFAKCGYKCDAPEHDEKPTSYCVLPAWHVAAARPATESDGYSYVGGHKFECSHKAAGAKMHHIFVLDASGSMQGSPWEKLIGAFREFVHNRVGMGATEDLVSVVTFSTSGRIVYEAQNISAMVEARVNYTSGGTSYGAGLRSANEVLSRVAFDEYKPVVVFFSDGRPMDGNQGEQLAGHIVHSYARYDLNAFVVGFGSINLGILQRVADKLGGTYCQVLTGDELKTTFHSISTSLGTRTGLALTKPVHELICVICQKELATEATTALVPCQHEFHQRCLRRLMECSTAGDTKRCPTCRAEIGDQP